MFAVVFRILLRAAFTLLLLTACVFFGLHMTGDPARIMLGNAADEVAVEAFLAGRIPYLGIERVVRETLAAFGAEPVVSLDQLAAVDDEARARAREAVAAC